MGVLGLVRPLAATLAALTTLALGSEASAFPKLQIHAVDLIGYEGTALRLSIELPCGSTFYGLVTRAAKPGTLEVAAAVAQDNIVCTSMPQPTTFLVDYL